MERSSSVLDYRFLLLAHTICVDQQIHQRELILFKQLGSQANINEISIREAEKIFNQDDECIKLGEVIGNISEGLRSQAIRQVLAISYVDGYLHPLERELIDVIAHAWEFHQEEIELLLEGAKHFSEWSSQNAKDNQNSKSILDWLLSGIKTLFTELLRSLLIHLIPDHLCKKVRSAKRRILLDGRDYLKVIENCKRIAREDFSYADEALKNSWKSLRKLSDEFQESIDILDEKTIAKSIESKDSVSEVRKQLETTKHNLAVKVLHDMETVRQVQKSKESSLQYFTIAVMGKTKVGKSTLHAVIVDEGWDAIGIGRQRTTRLNRVYEWKGIRIIDTPGIGAPGGKTDEEIANSIIEEADIIWYVVTNDSIQESEFAFLKALKNKTKPLHILLNIQNNLRDPRRLVRFLENPERLFTVEGSSGIGGHLNRINRYASKHYNNQYLKITPVMLLAAQMSTEPEHRVYSKKLLQSSKVPELLDFTRMSIMTDGAIRKSQTLLGSTVSSILSPKEWIAQEASQYVTTKLMLEKKRQDLSQKAHKLLQNSQSELQFRVKDIFKTVFEQVTPFAEEYWQEDRMQMETKWKQVLKETNCEERLNQIVRSSYEEYQDQLREEIRGIVAELGLVIELEGLGFRFPDLSDNFFDIFDKDVVKYVGIGMMVGGIVAAFVFPPLAVLGAVGGALAFFGNLLQSRNEKRHKAVKAISDSLNSQLKTCQEKILGDINLEFEKYCKNNASSVDEYLKELINGIEAISDRLKVCQEELASEIDILNRAYAKRIVDWAAGQIEPMTSLAIDSSIHRVNRSFGKFIEIQTKKPVTTLLSQDEMNTILQERVTIQLFNS